MKYAKFDGVLVSDRLGLSIKSSMPGLFAWAKNPSAAFYPFAVFVAASIAMINSYFLNRSFTFRVKGDEGKGGQAARLYIVGYIGLLLNLAISTPLNNIIPGHQKFSIAISTGTAAFFVAAWNFFGQRHFAFRVHRSE